MLLAAGVMASVPDTRMRPGLVMKAPEFSVEDDEYLNYYASLATDSNCSEDKELSSIANEDKRV